MKTDYEVMAEAIDMIRDIDNWCQGANSIEYRHRSSQFCAIGALTVAVEATARTVKQRLLCSPQLGRLQAMVETEIALQGYVHSLPEFNDRGWIPGLLGIRRPRGAEKIHAEVIQVMEKAAAKLAEAGQ